MNNPVRLKTVKLVGRMMKTFVEEGIILVSEEQEILRNLKHLASKGSLSPSVVPKLIDQKEAAEMLGIGYSNFKSLEKAGEFPFKRRMVGKSVRYRNVDILNYIMQEGE